ncbi:MAG: helix-turn-helix domain-containing protein [Aphanocapsa sp. GSE-SYN-MK-11-07L]|jgi:putative transcriptional regulator|nr:helix-turn-helix domain-containing protein [Aphanocapsa sp. GSE-SYN-MK-11-07L]
MATSLRTSTAPCTDTGLFVRQLRQLVNLTQAQFAEKLGVSIPTVARWENGKAQPSPLALMQLKTLLNELKASPHRLQRNCAQALLAGYFEAND